MIKTIEDIDISDEKGRLLLIAVGTIKAQSQYTSKPYKNYEEVISDLKDVEISHQLEKIIQTQ